MNEVPITVLLTQRHHYHHHRILSQFYFPLVILLLNQKSTPPLRLQFSGCSTFFCMCYIPSTAVFLENLLKVFLVFLPDTF